MTLSVWPSVASSEVGAFLAFLAAILLIDSYDISLPRGDSIGMSGPLVAAAVVEFGYPVALAMGIASTVAVQLARRMKGEESALVDELVVRALSTSLAAATAQILAVLGVGDLAVALVPATYLLTELVSRQALLARQGGRSLRRLLAGNMSRQAMLFAAQLSVAALTILTFASLGLWTVIPVAALLLLMRQAYSMLLDIRETYLTTVGVLVEAAESQSPDMAGHSERTAAIAREIGAKCGLGTSEIERLSYAALLHDIGRISDIDPEGESHPDSASMVCDIAFFSNVRTVLRILDGLTDPASSPEADLMASYIVALASDIDTVDHPSASFGDSMTSTSRLSQAVPRHFKAQVVSAAVAAGHPLPSIE